MRKHDPNKRAQNFFKGCRLWSWESEHENGHPISHGVTRRGFLWANLTQKQVDGIVAMQNSWILCVRSAMRWPDGTIATQQETVIVPNVKINELAEHYEKMRESVYQASVQSALFDMGWIATPKLDLKHNEAALTKFELFELGQYTKLRQLRFEGYCERLNMKEAV